MKTPLTIFDPPTDLPWMNIFLWQKAEVESLPNFDCLEKDCGILKTINAVSVRCEDFSFI